MQSQLFRMGVALAAGALLTLGGRFVPGTARAGVPPPLTVNLELITSLADQVVDIQSTGVAGDDRLFLVRKRGIIQIYDLGTSTLITTPFLDIDSIVIDTGNERGLLGLAFHPDYDSNGHFYVNYMNLSGDTVVARYGTTGDPNVADTSAPLQIIEIDQPSTNNNHNGGQIRFGPDDLLYIGMGDGGGGCDSAGGGCNAQKTDSLLGALLRIDVDGDDFPGDATRNYAIPLSNPFLLDGGVEDEIWAYGLRNPWRFSFDRSTGDLYIADVGQDGSDQREEINFQAAASTGGQNYGWPLAEGTICGPGTCPTGDCPTPIPSCGSLTFPLYDYSGVGAPCAITGGFVYRGNDISELTGRYVFTDWCSGDIVGLDVGTLDDPVIADTGFGPTTFGEDLDGELYVAVDNQIYKLVSAGTPTPTASPTATATPAPPASCPASPAAGCRSAGKDIVKLVDKADDSKDFFLWKWIKGASTAQTELGANPVGGSTTYAVCVYDETSGTPALVMEMLLDRAGDQCNGRPCFKAIGGEPPGGKGWKYKDRTGTADGIQKLIAKGSDAGKAKIILKAKGAGVPVPGAFSGTQYFQQDTDLVVQMLTNDGGACFESAFPMPALKSTDEQFKDKN